MIDSIRLGPDPIAHRNSDWPVASTPRRKYAHGSSRDFRRVRAQRRALRTHSIFMYVWTGKAGPDIQRFIYGLGFAQTIGLFRPACTRKIYLVSIYRFRYIQAPFDQ